jgi:uncharacterized protein RhaS with RHS repeats
MYDPRVGRWLSEDPLGFAPGDPNLYRYVGNSPTTLRDPSGLQQELPLEEEQRIRRELIKERDRLQKEYDRVGDEQLRLTKELEKVVEDLQDAIGELIRNVGAPLKVPPILGKIADYGQKIADLDARRKKTAIDLGRLDGSIIGIERRIRAKEDIIRRRGGKLEP